MQYSEKLKDPRWQKKRLELLDKHDWSCEVCCDRESTLHVHHKAYIHGCEPWDYHDDVYAVLCENCHKDEHDSIEIVLNSLLFHVKRSFLVSQVVALRSGLEKMYGEWPPNISGSAIGWAIGDKEMLEFIVSKYLQSIKGTK